MPDKVWEREQDMRHTRMGRRASAVRMGCERARAKIACTAAASVALCPIQLGASGSESTLPPRMLDA
jgi:hypothetical protein